MEYEEQVKIHEFFKAVINNDTKTVEKYIFDDISINYNDNLSKSTPLMFAIQENHPDIIKILLTYGADATIKNDMGQDAYEFAKLYAEKDGALNVNLLEEYKSF